MDTYGAYQAKTHLSKLLERVAKGDRITITRHGVPIAVLQPVDPQKAVDTAEVIQTIRAFRAQHRLDGLNIRELIEEGRR